MLKVSCNFDERFEIFIRNRFYYLMSPWQQYLVTRENFEKMYFSLLSIMYLKIMHKYSSHHCFFGIRVLGCIATLKDSKFILPQDAGNIFQQPSVIDNFNTFLSGQQKLMYHRQLFLSVHTFRDG